MEIVEQMRSGFPGGKKSEQPDVVSFEDWAESWCERKDSGKWMFYIQSSAKKILGNSYTAKEFEAEVNRLRRDSIKSLYGQVITRLNVLLKLQIRINSKFDCNSLTITDEVYQKMLKFLFDDKELFGYLYPKEIELFELLLSVMDTNTLKYLNRHEDCWECIALSEREKIYDILYYLVWNLGWDEMYFASLGLVPQESIHLSGFKIVGRSLHDYYSSSIKERAFFDYDVRLLHPKEYRLSRDLDQIFTYLEGIPEQEYEKALDRIIAKVNKISMGLKKKRTNQKTADKKSGKE